ncbi:phosphonate metabolism protein PhnP [Kushneria phosphatilytica]|uniref:Phosphonate metabolism protein PhnP n=1 Tax=Kushneria phosphatilytica TaxID=657387 RepID=A0A1S1NVR6_9GAMM|nr:phosphonate metabolism protein PhnP [Kushneria phosphatilytica]QEL12902.1 phosphonate metabolism protein PhnP [Kushneria phosphatilytica]
MTLRMLGTGNTAQVPRFGCRCAACQRARLISGHRRLPACAELIRTTREEDDASPQRLLLDAGRMDLAERYDGHPPEAIVLTHYHADHVQGLLHLRWGCGDPIPVFGPRDRVGFADLHKHPGLLSFQRPLRPLQPFMPIEQWPELELTPVPLRHSRPTLGYCIQGPQRRLAWLTDTCGLPEATERFLDQWQPDIVIIDAAHPPTEQAPRNHNSVPLALGILHRLAPRQAWLTHLGCEVDTLAMAGELELPPGVALAADGQTITL